MKYLVLLAILAIFSSLGVALYFMLAAWKLGYIHPTGIATGR
jgi:hypothetical protein